MMEPVLCTMSDGQTLEIYRVGWSSEQDLLPAGPGRDRFVAEAWALFDEVWASGPVSTREALDEMCRWHERAQRAERLVAELRGAAA